MINLRTAAAFLLVSLCVVAPAGAQNRISVASTFLLPGAPIPQSCIDQAKVLSRELDNFPLHPAQWHWIVVCDDASWQSLLRKSGQIGAPQTTMRVLDEILPEIIYATTDLEAATTLLRGTTLLNPDSPLAHPDHVIAHELAHIVLQTTDENRAETQALLWLKQREPAYLAWLRDRKPGQTSGTPARSGSDNPRRDETREAAPRNEPGRGERRIDSGENRPTLTQTASNNPAVPGQ